MEKGFIETTLAAGTYALAFEADWIQKVSHKLVVSVYSKEKVSTSHCNCLVETELS